MIINLVPVNIYHLRITKCSDPIKIFVSITLLNYKNVFSKLLIYFEMCVLFTYKLFKGCVLEKILISYSLLFHDYQTVHFYKIF